MIALSINGRDVYLPGAAPDFGHRIEVLHPHVVDKRTRRPWMSRGRAWSWRRVLGGHLVRLAPWQYHSRKGES